MTKLKLMIAALALITFSASAQQATEQAAPAPETTNVANGA